MLFVNRFKRRNYGVLLLNFNRIVCIFEDDNELSVFFCDYLILFVIYILFLFLVGGRFDVFDCVIDN